MSEIIGEQYIKRLRLHDYWYFDQLPSELKQFMREATTEFSGEEAFHTWLRERKDTRKALARLIQLDREYQADLCLAFGPTFPQG